MTTVDMVRAPHASPQPTVSMNHARIHMADSYRLKAIQDGREDLRLFYENQVRGLREKRGVS